MKTFIKVTEIWIPDQERTQLEFGSGLYGGLIEFLQESIFVNRSSDIIDLLSDMFGGLAGLTIYYLFFRPFFQFCLIK
jgi:glycopeptide antibiotics resistance protein